MIIKSAEFIDSVGTLRQLGDKNKPEIAFIGRSNVGKSSLINYLVNKKALARTSSTPGRTRLLNYFEINKEVYFVDLPGYGFAKGEKAEQAKWKSLIEGYFEASKNIKLICLLIDIRRNVTEQDLMMLNYMETYHLPFVIVVTKSDKIAKSKRRVEANRIAKEAGLGQDNVYICSSSLKIGKEELLAKFDQFIG